jgi:hypothetical protein
MVCEGSEGIPLFRGPSHLSVRPFSVAVVAPSLSLEIEEGTPVGLFGHPSLAPLPRLGGSFELPHTVPFIGFPVTLLR